MTGSSIISNLGLTSQEGFDGLLVDPEVQDLALLVEGERHQPPVVQPLLNPIPGLACDVQPPFHHARPDERGSSDFLGRFVQADEFAEEQGVQRLQDSEQAVLEREEKLAIRRFLAFAGYCFEVLMNEVRHIPPGEKGGKRVAGGMRARPETAGGIYHTLPK
jgi:hypothetical protein